MEEKKEFQVFTIRLTVEDHQKLKELAERQGISVAGLIRMFIRRSHKRVA